MEVHRIEFGVGDRKQMPVFMRVQVFAGRSEIRQIWVRKRQYRSTEQKMENHHTSSVNLEFRDPS
jgi:hypothetical protein